MIGIAIDFLIDLFLFLFPVLWASRELGLRPKRPLDLKPALNKLGFRRIPLLEFVKRTVVLFAALVIVSILLSWLFTVLQMNDLEMVAEGIERVKAVSPFFLAYILIIRVSVEDVFFRGFLVNRIGVIPSTLLFALAHVFYGSYAEVAGAFFLGLILALGFRKKQCLFPIIAAHMLYNFWALTFILGGI